MRARYLAWVETWLRAQNPDLPDLHIAAQSHYAPGPGMAFVEIYGVRHDRVRRRKLRSAANELLAHLGCEVLLEPGRDVYHLSPARPKSAHERMRMLHELRAALAGRRGPAP